MQYNPLSPEEKQVVLGTCLGDGGLTKWTKDPIKLQTRNASLYLGSTKKEYLLWKIAQMPSLFLGKVPKQYGVAKGSIGNWQTFSVVHPYLSDLYHQLYTKGKTVTRSYLNQLGPLGVATWYMDDGSRWISKKTGQRQGYLSTCSFTWKEHEIMSQWFRTIWGIEAIPKTMNCGSKKYPFLRFNATNLKRLIKLIKQYVPECMRYKIDLQYTNPELYNVEYLPVKTLMQTVNNDIV